MNVRLTSVAVLVGVALLAGCSSSADYADAPKDEAATTEIPRWIRDGVRIARATKAARDAENTPDRSGDLDSLLPTAGSGNKAGTLPPKDVVVAALTGAGLTATQASCIYDGVSANPQTAADVTAILDGLAAASAAQNPATTPAAIPGLANLSTESTTRLVMTLAPCLDQAAILSLLAVGQGAGGTEGSALTQLLNSAKGLDLSKLAGIDASAIAKAIGGSLGADELKQLQGLLAAVGSAQQTAATNPLALLGIDITKLDLSKLTQEQMPILVLALLKGLTPDQQGQLSQLVQVRLDELDIKVDPDQLTPEEIGSLLLILSPLLAGAIRTTPATVPPGGDPAQVYIPPGMDLSGMNPLIFLNRADVISQFEKQGISVAVGGCIFDGLARLPPSTIAAFFSDTAAAAAAGSVLLIAVSCVVQGG